MTLILDRQAHKLTPGNGLSLATGVLCVAGVSPYYSPSAGKVIWRLRHPDMLRRSAGLYTNTVILDEHPEALAKTYPRDRVVGGVGPADWDQEALQITGQLMLYDADTVLENGYFSHGILARCTPQSGVWKGVHFDEIIEIDEVNHIASTSQPRQGDRVRVLLDSDGMGGDYAIDPDSLKIVIPSIVLSTAGTPDPHYDGATLTQKTTDAALEDLAKKAPNMTPEELQQLIDSLNSSLSESIALAFLPVMEVISDLAERLGHLPETSPTQDPTDLPPIPDLMEDSTQALLTSALSIQSAAIPLGVICDTLSDIDTWEDIVKGIETAVGLGIDWDPSGMSIPSRLAACRAISSRSAATSVLLVDSVELPDVTKKAPPTPPTTASPTGTSVTQSAPTMIRFI